MMSSFFYSIWCCCSGRKSNDEDQDEQASLLPPPENGPSIMAYDSTTIDHQKAKERLHVIVKAKEGRMVRVLSRVPFNLRNVPSNGFTNASSSRSNHSPSTNVSYTNQHGPNHYHDANSEPYSPKYRPSSSASRSNSTSSVQQASNSRISIDDLSDRFAEHKLRVQLMPSVNGNRRAFSRRGRSRTRDGGLAQGAHGTSNVPVLEGIQSVDSGRENLDKPEDASAPSGTEEADKPSISTNADRPRVTPLSEEENSEIKAVSKQLLPILKDDFADIGTLTRSWGD